MKKPLLLLLACFIFLTSCGKASKSVIAIVNPGKCSVKFECCSQLYKYNLVYKSNERCEFIPTKGTVPISFHWKNADCFLKSNKNTQILHSNICTPYPVVIKEILDKTVGIHISPDYNGEYKHYGTCCRGEYCVELNNTGQIKKILIDKYLICEFT